MVKGQEVSTEESSSTLVPPVLQRSKSGNLALTAVFCCVLALTILLQTLGGAYTSEFSGYPDEPAHFITGLMIRDYVLAGLPESPVKYAEDYYFHYPKVAFGMWGPLLHVSEAAWTIIFPANRMSLLILMALFSSITAALLFSALLDEVAGVLAFLAALLFICVPTVQAYTGMVMADGLVALLDFCAALAFGRYLNSGKPRDSALFGIFACLGILTKGNAVALVLLPAFAIAFTRRFSLLKKPTFWIGPAIIGCIGGPWQYYSTRLLSGILERNAAGSFLPFYTKTIATVLGLGLLPFILAGLYSRFLAPALRNRLDGKWAAAASLIFSVWAFHSAVPAAAPEYRYVIAVLPPLLMFLMAGVAIAAERIRIPAVSPEYRVWSVAAVVLVVFFTTAFTIPHKLYHGFDEVADVLERPEYRDSEILVSSNANGEGMLISEMAMRERRPSHTILRASKMLAQSDWNGQRYRATYTTPEQILNYLRRIGVSIVVIDNDPGSDSFAHHALLRKTIEAFPSEWSAVGTYPRQREPQIAAHIDVYKLRSEPGSHRDKIRIDLPHTLGHEIER